MTDFDFSTLVTDRVAGDVSALGRLLGKPLDRWTAEELAAFNRAASRGAYNYTDLNRVSACMDALAERLRGCGYAVAYAPVRIPHGGGEGRDPYTWYEEDVPAQPLLDGYLQNVAGIRAALAVADGTPPVPETMAALTPERANDIERILLMAEGLLENMAAAWFYSGDLYAGEV